MCGDVVSHGVIDAEDLSEDNVFFMNLGEGVATKNSKT